MFAGTSGGGVLAGALAKAKTLPQGSTLLAMLPDTGERYLSTPLFDDVPADMTKEEQALAEQAPPTTPFPQAPHQNTQNTAACPAGAVRCHSSAHAAAPFCRQALPAPNDEGRAMVKQFVGSDKA